mgnify:CR=1 FL=1
MKKDKKSLAIIISLSLLLALIPGNITKADTNGDMRLVESNNEIKGEKELNKILEKFELNQEIPKNITITEEGSNIKIEQNLKTYMNDSGEIFENNSLTTIMDIQIPVENNENLPLKSLTNNAENNLIMPLASQGDDGVDTSAGCKASSTIYYDKSTKNGWNYVNITKATWSVSCNSGVKAYAFNTELGQVETLSYRDQILKTYYTVPFSSNNGTVYPPSTWQPVRAIYDGDGGSIVGINMNFTLGRSASGSKWNYTFVNTLR